MNKDFQISFTYAKNNLAYQNTKHKWKHERIFPILHIRVCNIKNYFENEGNSIENGKGDLPLTDQFKIQCF